MMDNLSKATAEAVKAIMDLWTLTLRHYGPGPHEGTGTPQDVHGRGGTRAMTAFELWFPVTESTRLKNKLDPAIIEKFHQAMRASGKKSVEDQRFFEEAWIDRDGMMYPLGGLTHDVTAERAFKATALEMSEVEDERKFARLLYHNAEIAATALGWLRLSGSAQMPAISWHIEMPPTDEQVSTAIKMIAKKGPEQLDKFVWDVNTLSFNPPNRVARYGEIQIGEGADSFYRWLDQNAPSVARSLVLTIRSILRHYGPGPHKGTGTSQDVHGGDGFSRTYDVPKKVFSDIMSQLPENWTEGIQILFSEEERSTHWPGRPEFTIAEEDIYGWLTGTDLNDVRVALQGHAFGHELIFDTPEAFTEHLSRQVIGHEVAHVLMDRIPPEQKTKLEKLAKRFGHHLDTKVINQYRYYYDQRKQEQESSILAQSGEKRLLREINAEAIRHYLTDRERFGKLPKTYRDAIENIFAGDPLIRRHYGPGPHEGTGTPQDVHGGGAPRAAITDPNRTRAFYESIPDIKAELERGKGLGIEYLLGLEEQVQHLTEIAVEAGKNIQLPDEFTEEQKALILAMRDSPEEIEERWRKRLTELGGPDELWMIHIMNEINSATEELGLPPVRILLRRQDDDYDGDTTAGKYVQNDRNPELARIEHYETDRGYRSAWPNINPADMAQAIEEGRFRPLQMAGLLYPSEWYSAHVHEIGHHVEHTSPEFSEARERSYELLGSIEEGVRPENVTPERQLKINENRIAIHGLISEYAIERPTELVAESYTMWKHPQFQDLHPKTKELVEYILGKSDDNPLAD